MQIFLSSTYLDLVEYRKAALYALERLGQQVGRMEVFGARPEEPVVASLDEVDKSDIFIGIYAHRYGHVPAGSRKSITAKEFDRARKMGKPLLCFVVDETYEWPTECMEEDPGKTLLREFKNRVKRALVTDSFREPLDLGMKVATSTARQIIERELCATRVDNLSEKQSREELVGLLELRRESIALELSAEADLKTRFLQLHRKNLIAIRTGKLLLSHLLTSEIHALLQAHYANGRSSKEMVKGNRANVIEDSFHHRSGSNRFKPILRYCMRLDGFETDQERSERNYPYTRELTQKAAPAPSRNTADLTAREVEIDPEVLGQSGWEVPILGAWIESVSNHHLERLRNYRERVAQANQRAVMKTLLLDNGETRCPHCWNSFPTKGKLGWNGERCPACQTRIELLSELRPEEYRGHLFVNGFVCLKCGCSLQSVSFFRFACRTFDRLVPNLERFT